MSALRCQSLLIDFACSIARQGHRFLEADTTLELQEFLSRLRAGYVTLERIRESRIHIAVARICGKATRWPGKLIDIADDIIERWKQRFGPVNEIRTLLYEPGGRLHGICTVVYAFVPYRDSCGTLMTNS
jgi:hypothetical protein